MQLTPSQSFEHVKESLVQYIETAYKIAHPAVFAERGQSLRLRGTVAQAPFIEATPSFPSAHKLVELERLHPDFVPAGIAELMQHGVPVDRFPLYTHQEEALLAAFSERPNLLVATGTGSGKTETFLLPILADILREACTWPAPDGDAQAGSYNAQANVWLHGRRHERRPAAMRAIVLYPMNALVNDQLSRLRRILSRGTSPDWQRRNLDGNVLHFGMYTGLSEPTGSWSDRWRRDKYAAYMAALREDWQKLREDLRDTGGWPRPDSPEMLCRWDIQMAPPDILITNYSMLEYMLVRPIENPIFEATRAWLQETPDARLTLVLDEAHTYTGAKGTEVAHLVRRLKERLGIESGSAKFRAIATSASIPNIPGADEKLRGFTSDLFGEPPHRFTLIRLATPHAPVSTRRPAAHALRAFASFHDTFDIQDPLPAIERLAQDLRHGQVDHTLDPQVSLHALLEHNDDIDWVRGRTARNATLLDLLADECWNTLGTAQERERATAGVLAAGSFARPSSLPDTPPLLSMRVHAFFRGVTGLWACMDPDCPEIDDQFRNPEGGRPVGKLYTDARPWCGSRCGARVLELFSCRHCGLLFLAGIPDSMRGSLWPWSDDLSGERQDIRNFQVFGVERPHPLFPVDHRSTRTTLSTHPGEPYARPVYEISPAEENSKPISPFPAQCPRCQHYRAPGVDGREVIEPLRTRGPQSFSVVVGEGFRNQPRAMHGNLPNYGRKALLFSDSRQEAAMLAANLRRNHGNDLFRQLMYRALHSCAPCAGTGYIDEQAPYVIGQPQQTIHRMCLTCQGTGRAAAPIPLTFDELRGRVIQLQLDRGINPTNGDVSDFFTRLAGGDLGPYADAELAFNVALRRELAEDEFALEPLGLATWRVRLPEQVGQFPYLSDEETRVFLRSVARILATEQALLPPPPFKPWEWNKKLVKDHERLVVIPASGKSGRQIVPYNLTPRRKLGRYVLAVAQALVSGGRLPDTYAAKRWVDGLHWPLWEALTGLGILQWAGAKISEHVPYGLPIDSFTLQPLDDMVHRCRSCAYIMSETLFDVCVRCGQCTQTVETVELRNFYRLAALHALPDSLFDDPYPLRASEHTAQIGSDEARNEERWFQDLFHDDQNHHDHRVDILSVTTTMEMGIDIGSLLCVGLRNVPPTVANYQQRAGRAGRRGSALATVFTYAQARSHDQYYFERPPEIVSDPPRVPALYLNNEVIARRHVRSVVLQGFFYALFRWRSGRGLFESWGTIADFHTSQTGPKLQHYLTIHRAPLIARCAKIIHPAFVPSLDAWLDALRTEVQGVADAGAARDGLFEELITSGLLPKYAFPIDVVRLSMPKGGHQQPLFGAGRGSESNDNDAMQRDLRVALSEYAPGGEIVRGNFPNTFKYRSVGVHDPFAKTPDYHPTAVLAECDDCQSATLIGIDDTPPDQCPECRGFNITSLPYLRPTGFTVDAALPNAGAEPYEGDGRERGGYVAPARLIVGQTSFTTGAPRVPFAPHLYTHVRVGELFACNKGPDRDFPGFLICPSCGRALDPDDTGSHTYPADIPPHHGRDRGPRAGQPCPNTTAFQNQVILGHKFFSEVILLGADLPLSLDAPYVEPSGKAIWYSFGTLLANAATRVLQIDPGELKTGARAAHRGPGRLHGEVFLYDDVPGGAGYARAVDQNLEEILAKALELGRACANPSCAGACYHCMYDYRNQSLHPLLDRALGTAMLEYLLHGQTPRLEPWRIDACGVALAEYARADWTVEPGVVVGSTRFPCILKNALGERIGLWVIHPLAARPSDDDRHAILAQFGLRCAVHTSFDLERRPFWVLNNLIRS